MKLHIVFGTRPEIIKLSKIIKIAKNSSDFDSALIHVGQHYSYNMSEIFLNELGLPNPDINLEVGSGTQAYQTGKAMIELEKLFIKEKPDVVIAQGDTNSVLAAALASAKLHIPFAHVEAGIRSFDRKMPEEINRILADQLSEFCFAPTGISVNNLKKEGILKEKIYFTGNTIVEVTRENLKIAKEKSKILEELGIIEGCYTVLTMHRAENADNKDRVKNLLQAIRDMHDEVIYPIHPRARVRLEEFGLLQLAESIKHLKLIEPLGYFDFLKLCSKSKLIISDSGGIQEEVTIYNKPIIIIRDSTERPEILGKFGYLVGFDSEEIAVRYSLLMDRCTDIKNLKTPFGDGKASERIMETIEDMRWKNTGHGMNLT